MASTYTLNRSDSSVLTTLHSLEYDGPGNFSTPRHIIDAKPSYTIIQFSGLNIVQIQGDFAARFPAGTTFTISGTTLNNGVKTVDVGGATYFLGPNETHIPVTGGVSPEIPPPAALITQHTAFSLFEDLTYRFIPTFTFTVQNSGGGLNDGLYTVASSLVHNNHTIIFVTVTIPSSGLPRGEIVYTIAASTSLMLPGKGTINFGEFLIEDIIRHLENFANPTPPLGPPSVGQLWYDTATGPASDLFAHWDGIAWSYDAFMSSGTITFLDPENPNQLPAAKMEITGGGGVPADDVGLRIRPTNLTPAGNSVLRVTDNVSTVGVGLELLRVEYAGYVRTSNNLEVRGTGDSFVYGRLGIGANGLPVMDRTLTVEGNGISINSDTGLDAVLEINPATLTNSAIIDFQIVGVSEGNIRIVGSTAGHPLEINSTTARNVHIVQGGGAVVIGGVGAPTTKLQVNGGQISADILSAVTPTYTFVGDLNTGMYSSGADTLDLSTGGVNKASFGVNSFTIYPGVQVAPVASLIAGTGLSGVGTGGSLFVEGGPGGSTSGTGGLLTLRGGVPIAGDGGGVDVFGRSGIGLNRSGGAVNIFAGNATGTGTGGSITIVAGDSPSGIDGIIDFRTNTTTKLTIDNDSIDTTVVIRNILGTALLPSYSFVADIDTGMYQEAGFPNTISFALAGSQKVKIDSTGITVFSGFFSPGALVPLTPEFSFSNDLDTGMFRRNANEIGFSTGGSTTLSVTTNGIELSNQKAIRLLELTANGTNYIALVAPASITTNRTWTLPQDDPATFAGKGLTTDAFGNLSFTLSDSWRDPVEVNDTSSLTIPSGTPGFPVVIDGVSITDDQRVLFSQTTNTAFRNVWIYDQPTGVFTEEVLNQETPGDVVYVRQGSSSGKVFAFNTSNEWREISGAGGLTLKYHRATSTASQTVFTLPAASAYTLSADGSRLLVYVNGVKQVFDNGSGAYTETDPVTVTFNVGLLAGQTVEFYAVANTTSNATLTREEQTGLVGNPTIAFTIITYVLGTDTLYVYLNGVKQIVNQNFTELTTSTISWDGPALVASDIFEFYSGVPVVSGTGLQDIIDVANTPPNNGDTIVYNSSNGLWEPAAGGGGGQSSIQFRDEGVNLGTSGTVGIVDFVGTGVTATRVVNTLTVAISGGGTPGGAITQVQFNDGGTFGGDDGLTWDKTNNVLNVGTTAVPGIITGKDATAAVGSTLIVEAGNGDGVGNAGGALTLRGGTATDGNGGTVNITGRDGVGTNRDGGDVLLTAGLATGSGDPGNVELIAGDAGSSFAGQIFLAGGTSATGGGGNIDLVAGPGATQGGDVSFRAGGGTTLRGGDINMQTGGAGVGAQPGNIQKIMFGGFETSRTGNFGSDGDAQTREYLPRTITTNATITEMFLDGTGGTRRMVVPDNSTWHFEVKVVARRADADNEGAAYKFEGALDRNTGAASIALIGTVLSTLVAEDTAAWDVAVDVDTTNGALRIRVTGEIGKTIRWLAFVRTVEVTG